MEVYYVQAVKKFIQELPYSQRRRVDRMHTILEEYGYTLRHPYAKALGDGLFELRIVDEVHIRFIYFYHLNQIIVVHGLIKKRQRLRRKDIEFAQKMREMIIASI